MAEAAGGRLGSADILGANIVASEVDGGRIADNIVQFARLLRASGLPVGPQKTVLAVRAVMAAGLSDPKVLYWTLHAVFVNRRAEREIFNQAFVLFWRDPDYIKKMLSLVVPQYKPPPDKAQDKALARRLAEAMVSGHLPEFSRESDEIEFTAEATFSDREAFHAKDFEEMSAAELARARAEISRLTLPFEEMRTRRAAPVRQGGALDMRRILREVGQKGAEHLRDLRQRPRTRRLSIVVLADISGSMDSYARILLHFIYALSNDRDEVHAFLFGTRLSNVTHLIKDRDPDRAISKVSSKVSDWSGGTRIGQCLEEFNRRWARRVLGRNAIVLLFTDGLDRDGAEGIDRAARRLAANAHRLIWLNPLTRYHGYEPLAAGAAALSKHVTEMRDCHNLRSLGDLAKALGGRR
jgi:uncharacterized protein with von Willebrand factor type A (vWA) domain